MHKHLRPRTNLTFAIFIIFLMILLVACSDDVKEKDNESSPQYTIGIINLTSTLDPVVDGFKSQMTELGYIEGKNLTYRYDGPAPSIGSLDSIAQELVEADVDLILCVSTPATQAVIRATTEKPIPCVFAPIQDPVRSGLVPSLSQPGGNLTGITFGVGEGKRLEWLTRIVPDVERVYIAYNVDDPAPSAALVLVSEVADQLGVELVLQPARNAEEVRTAFENIPDDIDAIMLLPDSILAQSIDIIIAASLEHDLPLTVTLTDTVYKGALLSYGMESRHVGEQAARLADQILQGTSPADLPVEVSEFFLTINLQTAETIGLEIPDDILQQADFIIRDEE